MLEIAVFAENHQLSQSYTHFCILFFSIISKIKNFEGLFNSPVNNLCERYHKKFLLRFWQNIQKFEEIFNVVSLAYDGQIPIILGGDVTSVKATVGQP